MSNEPTSAENPWPVREVNSKVKAWIERLGSVWVEGQLAQVNMKPSWRFSYLTLRDVEAEMSLQVTCDTALLQNAPAPLRDGDRVVVYGKPTFFTGRGSFSLRATEIRPVGVGELLARIERLRQQLASEGLFDASRKLPLPYLPRCIGLITGRGSAAERDVLSVAEDRWPHVNFKVINTAVQGAPAVPEVIAALEALDADPEVDVIIIARGGGSVEDLLPFSAAPPTDAAKRVVPDAREELLRLDQLHQRAAAALRGWVDRQQQNLQALRSRPVLADPFTPITRQEEEVQRALTMVRRDITYLLNSHESQVRALRAQVSALGPSATLARGYSVVQVIPRDGSKPEVVTSYEQAPPGSQLRIRVADGSVTAASIAHSPAD